MADLKINGVTPSDIKLGSSDVSKVYQGSTLVWPLISPIIISETVISDILKIFNATGMTVSQSITVESTLISRSFANPGVTNISFSSGGSILYNVSDNNIYTIITGSYANSIYLNSSTVGDSCTVRCEITNLGVDTIPTPAYLDISFYVPIP